MDFELWWLFIIIPAVFALGWGASRFDLRQWRKEQLDAPRAYFKGLSFLLNEQQDKAIDAFIEAVQADPDTTDLHFALGSLFRRRGEYERAVRVHQHLLGRADLPHTERDRAQYALALDYLKSGLLDRAEQAFHVLEKIPAYSREAHAALLTLYERAHDWSRAIEVSAFLETEQAGTYAPKRAHYHCEIAAQAQQQGDWAKVIYELKLAHQESPESPRPLIEMAGYYLRQNEHQKAFKYWKQLSRCAPRFVALIAQDIAKEGQSLPQIIDHTPSGQHSDLQSNPWRETAYDILQSTYAHQPSLGTLTALVDMESDPHQKHHRLLGYLQEHPSAIACAELISITQSQSNRSELEVLKKTLDHVAKPLDRYRCVACGFEAVHYFWQCPGCQTWDSYPPYRIEEF